MLQFESKAVKIHIQPDQTGSKAVFQNLFSVLLFAYFLAHKTACGLSNTNQCERAEKQASPRVSLLSMSQRIVSPCIHIKC